MSIIKKRKLKIEQPKKIKNYAHYQSSTLGTSLRSALNDLVSNDDIPEHIALNCLDYFDKAINKKLTEIPTIEFIDFTGEIKSYRSCDDVWAFTINDATFITEGGEKVKSNKIKIVV